MNYKDNINSPIYDPPIYDDEVLIDMWGSDFDVDSDRSDIEYISFPAWRTKDNVLIPIKDMETSHIKNCIKMIYKSNGTWRP